MLCKGPDMDESIRTALRRELGTSPPKFLDELDEAELHDLATVLAGARAPGGGGRGGDRQGDAIPAVGAARHRSQGADRVSGLELKRRAELVKLGRLLSEPPERLRYRARLEPDQLRELRELATDVHYDFDRDRFKRIAFASMLLPTGLTALIACKAFGALLCARIAGVLNTDHAIALAAHMPAKFLADLAVELDPRRASAIIAGMPPEQIAEVAEVLAARGEFVAMGRFVGHMTDEAITRSLAVIDEPSLLRISYVLEGDEGLERVIRLMSSAQLESAIRAATDHDLGRRRSTCSGVSRSSWRAGSATPPPVRTTACSRAWSRRRSATRCGTSSCR